MKIFGGSFNGVLILTSKVQVFYQHVMLVQLKRTNFICGNAAIYASKGFRNQIPCQVFTAKIISTMETKNLSIYWLLCVQYSTRTYLHALHHSKVKLEKHFLCKSVMLFGDYLTIASDPSFCRDVGNRMSLTVTDVILVGRDIFCLFVVQKGAGIQQTVWVRVFLGHM